MINQIEGSQAQGVSVADVSEADVLGSIAQRRMGETDGDLLELLAALRPFAEDGALYQASVPDSIVPTIFCEEHGTKSPACFSVGDLRRAQSLLAEYEPRLKLWRDLATASKMVLPDDGNLFEPASGMSASGQDPEGLEAKPASPVAESETPNPGQEEPV